MEEIRHITNYLPKFKLRSLSIQENLLSLFPKQGYSLTLNEKITYSLHPDVVIGKTECDNVHKGTEQHTLNANNMRWNVSK